MRICKKIYVILVISFLSCSGTLVASATFNTGVNIIQTGNYFYQNPKVLDYNDINLPTVPVTMTAIINHLTSYFLMTLSNVPSGYDVTDGGSYLGWCVNPNYGIPTGTPFQVTLYSSYDSALPSYLQGYEWDKINYIINHKQGTPNVYPYDYEIQFAIWYIIGYHVMDQYLDANGWAMINDANTFGDGYIPASGEILAVIADPGPSMQTTIIELAIPEETPPSYEGLTPGFWKNHQDVWVIYQPGQNLDSVFPISIVLVGTKTFIEALNFNGGPLLFGAARILLRSAVASLLNAAHPDVNYPLSEVEIINQVNSALQSFNRAAMLDLANTLDIYNNLGCEDL